MSLVASSQRIRVGIVGVSGYSGMELARILAGHPRLTLGLATSDKWAGKTLGAKMPLAGDAGALVIASQEQGAGRFGEVDLLFLCTPAEASLELAPKGLRAGARVVDLSGAFRLSAADFPRWYGFTHGDPALLESAIYSMPEATPGVKERLREARLVSNPGCFPTASALAVLPLLTAGVIEAEGLIIDAKSGTTGAGRKATEEMSFSEVQDDFRAYRVLKHQHTPEIERVLTQAGHPARVVFTTHLLPTRRGILATAYGRLTPEARGQDATTLAGRALEAFAGAHPFVHVAPPEEVTLRAVVGTNRVLLGARADVERGIVVAFGAIDNLVKGAAGQAVQNANLMFGLQETLGLDTLMGHAP